jgi:DNA-binding NarL/FixJ family response regulator
MEVLALLVEGLNNREIAERLVVSRATAKAHVSHILGKMDVSNRGEAIALALREGLIL